VHIGPRNALACMEKEDRDGGIPVIEDRTAETVGILGACGSRPREKLPTSVGKPSRLEAPPRISSDAGVGAADRMRASATLLRR
jgi:hypothetical protein